jgi:hypothetical protein
MQTVFTTEKVTQVEVYIFCIWDLVVQVSAIVHSLFRFYIFCHLSKKLLCDILIWSSLHSTNSPPLQTFMINVLSHL